MTIIATTTVSMITNPEPGEYYSHGWTVALEVMPDLTLRLALVSYSELERDGPEAPWRTRLAMRASDPTRDEAIPIMSGRLIRKAYDRLLNSVCSRAATALHDALLTGFTGEDLPSTGDPT